MQLNPATTTTSNDVPHGTALTKVSRLQVGRDEQNIEEECAEGDVVSGGYWLCWSMIMMLHKFGPATDLCFRWMIG